VDGWQWYQSIAGIRAVRRVSNREWQWQYWPSCGGLKEPKKKKDIKNWGVTLWQYKDTCGCTGSGSGRLQFVPLDSPDQCGSNGTQNNVAVAVLV
jgi:hypothetical protein